MSKGDSGLFDGTTGKIVQDGGRIIPGADGVVSGGSSSKLGRRLLRDMGVKGRRKWAGYQAHHVIPVEVRDHPVLQKIGMDLDDVSNGIFLRIPDGGISTGSRHTGYHNVYSDFVKSQLNKIDIHQSSLAIQQQVKDLQGKLRRLMRSGLPMYDSDNATVDLWQRQFNKLR